MKTTTKNIGLYKVGTLFCIEVTDVKNVGSEAISNVEVAVTVPDGVTYNSGSFPQGSYDSGTNKWLVGTLLAGADLTATFCYEVTDATKGPFSFVFTISSPNSCVDCDTDRQFCVIVDGFSCAEVQSCESYSLTELLTGQLWVDDKPIYKRTWSVTADNTAQDLTGLTIATVETFIKNEVRYTEADGDQVSTSVTLSDADSNGNGVWEVTVPTGSNAYITVWYTKV